MVPRKEKESNNSPPEQIKSAARSNSLDFLELHFDTLVLVRPRSEHSSSTSENPVARFQIHHKFVPELVHLLISGSSQTRSGHINHTLVTH